MIDKDEMLGALRRMGQEGHATLKALEETFGGDDARRREEEDQRLADLVIEVGKLKREVEVMPSGARKRVKKQKYDEAEAELKELAQHIEKRSVDENQGVAAGHQRQGADEEEAQQFPCLPLPFNTPPTCGWLFSQCGARLSTLSLCRLTSQHFIGQWRSWSRLRPVQRVCPESAASL